MFHEDILYIFYRKHIKKKIHPQISDIQIVVSQLNIVLH